MRWLISGVVLLSCWVRAAYVVNNAGRTIQGSEISATADGRVTLETPDGQRMVFQKDQYKRAVADRPKELDIAEQLIASGQGEKAVPFLQQAKKKCRFLQWDQAAIQMLADYYFVTEQYEAAVAELQALDDQSIPQNRRRLREAMVKSGAMETALQVFNEDIRDGSREAAAQAYLMRGKLKAEHGDPEGARRDWQKVALFFRMQEAAAEQAEQLLKENEG